MGSIEQSVEVDVPVSTAYNQWTQFEKFPAFMQGVERVDQLTDTKLHWVAEIGGQTREWDSTITEQTPDQRIAWTSEGNDGTEGVVTFHHLADDKCKVMLQLDYKAEGLVEKAGEMLGVINHRVKDDLKNFKEMIEERGSETGGWRGEVKQDG